MESSIAFFQIVRALIIGGMAFIGAMLIEPLMYRVLLSFGRGKQIRTEGAPVFASLHAKKAGTPTMGGIMIWLVVFVHFYCLHFQKFLMVFGPGFLFYPENRLCFLLLLLFLLPWWG